MSDDADYLRNVAIPFGAHVRGALDKIAARIDERESRLEAAEKALSEKRGFGDPVSFMEHHALQTRLASCEKERDTMRNSAMATSAEEYLREQLRQTQRLLDHSEKERAALLKDNDCRGNHIDRLIVERNAALDRLDAIVKAIAGPYHIPRTQDELRATLDTLTLVVEKVQGLAKGSIVVEPEVRGSQRGNIVPPALSDSDVEIPERKFTCPDDCSPMQRAPHDPSCKFFVVERHEFPSIPQWIDDQIKAADDMKHAPLFRCATCGEPYICGPTRWEPACQCKIV